MLVAVTVTVMQGSNESGWQLHLSLNTSSVQSSQISVQWSSISLRRSAAILHSMIQSFSCYNYYTYFNLLILLSPMESLQ